MAESCSVPRANHELRAILEEIVDALTGIRAALDRIDETLNEARPHFGVPKREQTREDGTFKSRYDES